MDNKMVDSGWAFFLQMYQKLMGGSAINFTITTFITYFLRQIIVYNSTQLLYLDSILVWNFAKQFVDHASLTFLWFGFLAEVTSRIR